MHNTTTDLVLVRKPMFAENLTNVARSGVWIEYYTDLLGIFVQCIVLAQEIVQCVTGL